MNSEAEAKELCNKMFREIERIHGGVDEMSAIIGKIQDLGMGMYPAFVSTMKLITFAVSTGQLSPEEGALISTDLMKFILSPETRARMQQKIKELAENGLDKAELDQTVIRKLMKTTQSLNIPEYIVSSAIGIDIGTKESDFIPEKETVH